MFRGFDFTFHFRKVFLETGVGPHLVDDGLREDATGMDVLCGAALDRLRHHAVPADAAADGENVVALVGKKIGEHQG